MKQSDRRNLEQYVLFSFAQVNYQEKNQAHSCCQFITADFRALEFDHFFDDS